MKWMAGVVVVVLVAVAVVVATRPRGSGEIDPASASGSAQGGSSGTVSAGGGAPRPEPTADEAALARLRAEIARAEPVAYRSDEQRLADARAWVAANRPGDRAYNEIEAKMLALMDVFAEGEKRSAEWVMNMSQIEVEMIRAIDADGDGTVSDEEVRMFVDDGLTMMFNPMEHPYLRDRFDTNGDGEVGPEEMAAFASSMGQGALAGAFERGKANSWDSDNDGFVSAEERVAGEAAADERFREMFGEMASSMDLSSLTEEQRAQISEEQMRALDGTRQMLRDQAAAADLLEAMRLDDLPQPDPAELMKDMPQPPDGMSFDADGDGAITGDEQAALQQAMRDYQAEAQNWGAVLTANRLRQQFEHSATRHDADGDGLMTDGEWDDRVNDLLIEREQRLFRLNYDLDQSGRVDAIELNTFMTWYGKNSPRADANFDGAVDVRDLEFVVSTFQRQGN